MPLSWRIIPDIMIFAQPPTNPMSSKAAAEIDTAANPKQKQGEAMTTTHWLHCLMAY
jgi:hypothetical protein